eukprot:TRINITY_DN48923_c0_g1_i1.p2 TRINITY_DN48923_c0_g1~~TRINITY_DN48923_c0_g1_i1.p2  ORF type:complete len:114 (-),score=11.14 TRINITY_DN48923_c0_g1_i1:78-419(-)
MDFQAKFSLTVTTKQNLNGLVVWFDALFDLKCKEVKLSTSPKTPETHWKQSVFYLATPVAVLKDDKIEGSLRAKRARGYKRDYEVEITYTHVPAIPLPSGTKPTTWTQEYTIT